MPEITETELKKQIRGSEFQKFYFLYGEEKYLVGYYADRILSKADAGGPPDFNLQRMDGETAGIDAIASAVEALPVLAGRKCVAVRDLDVPALKAGETAKFRQLLSDLPETCVLVVYELSLAVDGYRNKGWKKFLKEAAGAGCVVRFRERTKYQLGKELCRLAERRGCTLSQQNAAHLIGFCGTGMLTAFSEIEKLCAYTESGEITAQTIDRLTTRNLEARVFELSNAVFAGDGTRVYEILNGLFFQNEEPVGILSVLSLAYLDVYRVRAAVQSGLSALEPAKYFNYRGVEFRLERAERICGRFSTSMIRDSLEALFQADTALKSARGSRRILLERLIARLLLIGKGEKAD